MIKNNNNCMILKMFKINTNTLVKDETYNAKFIDEFKMKWDKLHKEVGIFRYQIGFIQERILENNYLLQLNPNRGTKRRMPETFDSICQQFDYEKFNFTKAAGKEVLFTFTSHNDDSDEHAILINVSPINRYHSLLCPSINKCLPQVVTQESLKLALDFMLFIEDRELKMAFNGLCAFASVNHLHYHLLFEHRTLPVEVVKCKQIKGPLHCLDDYVVPTFCFEVTQKQHTDEAAENIFKLLMFLLQRSIAHNILLSWCKSIICPGEEAIRVFIWPRKKSTGAKLFGAFNVAVCEFSGWFLAYDQREFTNITYKHLEAELKKWEYDQFSELCEEVKSLF